MAEVELGQGNLDGLGLGNRLESPLLILGASSWPEHPEEIADVKGKGKAAWWSLWLISRNLPGHVIVSAFSIVAQDLIGLLNLLKGLLIASLVRMVLQSPALIGLLDVSWIGILF
jgi:hypothetical protein